MTDFSYEEIAKLIESELEYPTPWPAQAELDYREFELSYQTAAQIAVKETKRSLLKRLEDMKRARYRCMCNVPVIKTGSGLCQKCEGNLPRDN